MILPAAAPSRLATPPPSTLPLIDTVPAALRVKSLITVCTDHRVKFWPAATVHVCGAPTKTGELIVTLWLAVMPPAVTVRAPPLIE